MDKQSLEQFNEQGYVHFQQVLEPRDVAALRAAAEPFFAAGRSHMFTRDFLRIPQLARLPFDKRIVERIRSVFGVDYATVNQYSMSANLHNPQWHRDSQSQQGQGYLFDPQYLVSKCAVYLQDNDTEWGGGMEVLPRSHRAEYLGVQSSFSRANPVGKIVRLAQRASLRIRTLRLEPLWLPSRAGDVLLFHANLLHRASQPAGDKERRGHMNVALAHPPRDKFKYLIDWEASPDNAYLPTYLLHQKSRALGGEGLFRESLDARFPDDYDDGLVAHIQRLGLRIAQYAEVGDPKERAAR